MFQSLICMNRLLLQVGSQSHRKPHGYIVNWLPAIAWGKLTAYGRIQSLNQLSIIMRVPEGLALINPATMV